MLDQTEIHTNELAMTIEEIENAVGLVRRGDSVSLAEVRRYLGISARGIADSLGITEVILKSWEDGKTKPANNQLIAWRLKIGDFVDERIASYIRTNNKDLITQFWEIMWRLNDLKTSR
jgi:DNA-binding transcriptional regulator YiaG